MTTKGNSWICINIIDINVENAGESNKDNKDPDKYNWLKRGFNTQCKKITNRSDYYDLTYDL